MRTAKEKPFDLPIKDELDKLTLADMIKTIQYINRRIMDANLDEDAEIDAEID